MQKKFILKNTETGEYVYDMEYDEDNIPFATYSDRTNAWEMDKGEVNMFLKALKNTDDVFEMIIIVKHKFD